MGFLPRSNPKKNRRFFELDPAVENTGFVGHFGDCSCLSRDITFVVTVTVCGNDRIYGTNGMITIQQYIKSIRT